MGVVYLARERALDRAVDIKVLTPDLSVDAACRQRFLREARTAAGLSHPHIVPVFAVDEPDGGEFVMFAMAHVAGETLAACVAQRGPLAPREAARLLREIGEALAYAHGRGVVHRDVKPDNILIDAPTGRALLSDFGIAQVGRDGPGTSAVIGTAAFMSPEQARGDPVDQRSDIYSLGVVAYYALAGRPPFEAPSDAAVLALHIADPAPPLTSVAPSVPTRLAQVVDRCLAKDPWARFAGAAARRARLHLWSRAAAVRARARMAVAGRLGHRGRGGARARRPHSLPMANRRGRRGGCPPLRGGGPGPHGAAHRAAWRAPAALLARCGGTVAVPSRGSGRAPRTHRQADRALE
jgi:eukaryotic-like serine/threonine-protein kinase